MSISSSLGVGSGIDINGLVQQLVTADGQPAFNALDRQESSAKARISALGKLKSALSDFQTAVTKLKSGSIFKAQTATSSNDTIATATASVGAVAGRYSVEVVDMAKSQKAYTNANFTGLNAAVGEGTLNFAVGTKTPFSVTIDSAHNTLTGVRDAINGSTANNGVRASIINVDDGTGATVSKLVLSASEPGTANSFTVSGTASGGAGGGLTQLFSAQLHEVNPATDAVIKVDGLTATRSTNSISDVIPGITLDLKSVPTTSTPFNVDVQLDSKTITDNSQGFVDAYNKLQTVLKDLGKYDPATKAAGALLGDSTLKTVQSQIRQATGTPVTSATSNINSLSMVGINIDRSGVMSLDSTKFKAALNNNLSALGEVFGSTNGVATRLDSKISQVLQSGGLLDSQTTSLNNRVQKLSDDRADVQLRLDNLQKTLLKQFTAMDSAVGQFRATGTYLSKQFG